MKAAPPNRLLTPLRLQREGAFKRDGAYAARDARDVAEANQEAAQQSDALMRQLLGPRQLFAQAVEGALQGGRAAILTPLDRDALLAHARTLALRPFDAHLIIATVQDAARRGERAWLNADMPNVQASSPANSESVAPPIMPRFHQADASSTADAQSHARSRRSIVGSAAIAAVLAVFLLATFIVLLGP